MVCLGIEPVAAGLKAQTNPLSYGGTPNLIIFTAVRGLFVPLKHKFTKKCFTISTQYSMLIFELTTSTYLVSSHNHKTRAPMTTSICYQSSEMPTYHKKICHFVCGRCGSPRLGKIYQMISRDVQFKCGLFIKWVISTHFSNKQISYTVYFTGLDQSCPVRDGLGNDDLPVVLA